MIFKIELNKQDDMMNNYKKNLNSKKIDASIKLIKTDAKLLYLR